MANYEVPEELKKMREKEIERLNELDDLKEKVQVGKLVLASYVGYKGKSPSWEISFS